MDKARLRALVDVGRTIISELDPDALLRRLLDVARELTGARYAAIGVLDERREELERFITAGIEPERHRAIGDLPRGRGVLGVLIERAQPVRIADVGEHARSYGFPPGHPPMTTFLGVPIVVDGQAWGNFYLTEKQGGEPFTAEDEESIVILAEWAAVTIHNAWLYRDVRRRHDELERANRGLETTAEVSRALGGVTDVRTAFELVVKRSRALLGARAAELALLEGGEIVIAAAAGEGAGVLAGARVPLEDSVAAQVVAAGRAVRFDELPPGSFAAREIRARRAIGTPLIFRSRPVGLLVVFDRMDGDEPFTVDDQRLLEAFAASAATAVATAQSATDEALRRSLHASEAERGRWARELHDETLQDLAALRVLLSGARRSGDRGVLEAAVDQAVEQIAIGIENLRALITDLRPAALDELGTGAALEALVKRVGGASGLRVELELDMDYEAGRSRARYTSEIESTVYRLVQESLTNIVKHAGAESVSVRVVDQADACLVEITDDGAGFDPEQRTAGFGLAGMRERLALVRATLEIDSAPGRGTTVRARIPIARRPAAVSAAPATRAPALRRRAGGP